MPFWVLRILTDEEFQLHKIKWESWDFLQIDSKVFISLFLRKLCFCIFVVEKKRVGKAWMMNALIPEVSTWVGVQFTFC